MAVQAQAVDVPRARRFRWSALLGPLLLLGLGAIFILLGAYSTEPDVTSTFTDVDVGNLFSLPSQATLYAVGALCFFVAGMQLFRRLNTLRSVLNWLLAFAAAFPLYMTTKYGMRRKKRNWIGIQINSVILAGLSMEGGSPMISPKSMCDKCGMHNMA